MGEWIAVYIGVGGTNKLGINTGEWVTIGEEEDQRLTAGGGGRRTIIKERERGILWERDKIQMYVLDDTNTIW
jgi:hypothetical protein